MSKHTPGPWTIGECLYGEYDETTESYTPARGYLIHEAHGLGEHIAIVGGADTDYTERTEGAARARLIAAAPELLAVLERIAAVDDNRDITPTRDEMKRWAREAIAKAKS